MHSKETECRHFKGIRNKTCEAGVEYPKVPGCYRCLEGGTGCEKFEHYTKEEIDTENKQRQHSIECMKKDISTCCEAPIDKSYVISSERHKGHGPRYCSKCGKCVFFV